MRKLSSIKFSNTNRLHLVLVIRIYFDKILNYSKVQVARSWANKNRLACPEFIGYVQNQVLCTGFPKWSWLKGGQESQLGTIGGQANFLG